MNAHGHALCPGDVDRFLDRGRAHHQAGARQDAVAVRTSHRFIDFHAEAEVIGRHHQSLHTSIILLRLSTKTRPRQYTLRPNKLASHTNRLAVSRSGSSHSRRIPSRSPRSAAVTTVVPSRTASVAVSTSHDPGPPR